MLDAIDRDVLRTLTGWDSHGLPVSTLYLDVDGRRYPRRQDVEARADALSHELHPSSEDAGREARRSIQEDVRKFLDFVRQLDRGATRGLALFSSSGAGLWHDVTLPRPLPDRAVVSSTPHVLPLEAVVEAFETYCTVLVDRERARIFLTRAGRVHEQTDLWDDVPGRHDQGGWAQARFQRHIEEHVGRHLKHVGDVLLRLERRDRFDHLILAGPDEAVAEFERGLHDYLRRCVVARVHLPMAATAKEVLERATEVEERREVERERAIVERLTAGARAGRGAVIGLAPTLAALNEARVDTLVVPFGRSAPGVHCPRCGWLGGDGSECPVCGGETEAVADVVESGVEKALRQSARVETLSFLDGRGSPLPDVGALLRF
jgi:peptide chain release factor subunit 1